MSEPRPHGSGHWIAQRVTAVALAPLGLWLVFTLASQSDTSREAWLGLLATPWRVTLAGLLLVCLLLHSWLGVQVVIEDYVATPGRERALQVLSGAVHLGAALAGLYSLYLIAYGAGA